MNGPLRGLWLATAGLLGGCVTGSWNHVVVDEPIAADVVASLRPGVDTLTECLDRLGAPSRVYEYAVARDGSSGMALLWCWRDATGWGLDVSSGDDNVPGSLSYDGLSTDLPGCVLWFGDDLVLARCRCGTVGELLPGRRRPSAPADG